MQLHQSLDSNICFFYISLFETKMNNYGRFHKTELHHSLKLCLSQALRGFMKNVLYMRDLSQFIIPADRITAIPWQI